MAGIVIQDAELINNVKNRKMHLCHCHPPGTMVQIMQRCRLLWSSIYIITSVCKISGCHWQIKTTGNVQQCWRLKYALWPLKRWIQKTSLVSKLILNSIRLKWWLLSVFSGSTMHVTDCFWKACQPETSKKLLKLNQAIINNKYKKCLKIPVH